MKYNDNDKLLKGWNYMIKLLSDMDLENKKVLLRVDYNVPVKDGAILDENKNKT